MSARLWAAALSLSLFAGLGNVAVARDFSLQEQRLSESMAVYVGDNLDDMSILEGGRYKGQESYENRYGIYPQTKDTLISQHLTQPFALSHGKRTRLVFAYVHGITDSSFQGKDLARSMFKAGSNSIVGLLSGHGDDQDEIGEVGLQAWLDDIDKLVAQALLLGDEVVLMGLSTGGADIVERAFRNPEHIAGLVPIAPAIGIANKVVNWLEVVPGALPFLSRFLPKVGSTNTDQLEVRQKRKNTHSLDTLYKLGKRVQAEMASGKKLMMPALIVSSDADKAIDLSQVPKLVNAMPNAKYLQLTGQPHASMAYSPDYVAHFEYSQEKRADGSPLPQLPFASLSEANTQYDYMVSEIIKMFPACDDKLK